MKKIIRCVAITLLFISVYVFAAESQIEAVFEEGWSSEYIEMLREYIDACDFDENDQTEAILYACENMKSVIEETTRKKIALSQHTVAVFHRQGIAANIILTLVVVIVLAGVAMAAYQLWIAATKGAPQSNTELEASASKVRITSSSVGISILALSLLFLYLYIKEVFEISVIQI